ncbi:MAG: glycosyltransferase family 9 protein [Bacteroidetes bacterium]|nr:glycosyltransferase family 9 protein [Bacteroidota bacterium]
MASFEKSLKRFLLRLAALFRPSGFFTPQEIPIESFKKILVIRQHDQLGDLLITTPALHALRKKFPYAFIAVVVREYTAPVMLNNPNVDEVIIFYEKLKRWNISRLVHFWRRLRSSGGFDCTIVLNTISRSTSSDVIALLSKAKYIVGPDHLPKEKNDSELIYTVLSHRSEKLQTEIEHNLDIVSVLGAAPDGFEYDLAVTNRERIEAENIFLAMAVPKGKKVIGVHFGTLDTTRRFPLEKLAELINWMKEKYSAEIILIIGPNETESREYLLSLLRYPVISAPIMKLRVAAAFMKHLNVFLCNDTGTLHIASAMRVPTVSFHSLNDPAVWKPPHPRHIAVRAEDHRITSITVAMAQEAVKKQLG